MADEERKCLLAEDEDAPQWDRSSGDRGSKGHTPRQIINSLYESDQVLGRHSPFRGDASSSAANEGGVINISASHSPVQFHRSSDSDRIVAVFVVAFDTKAGNVIEWRSPEDVDLDGIEFKALTSGSHTMKTDFVYFRKGNLFGLACFENMPVDNMVERGARMKSVGILATSYTLLYRHMQFLESQVRFMIRYVESVACLDISRSERHQLETPGRYEQLKAFWEDKKGIICGGRTSLASTPTEYITSELKITHPSKCFSQFLQFFGHQVLTLWKFALLGKRILFFSPPPIGVVCYRVYCTCCLANHSMHRMLSNSDVKPYFYINVADIDEIESEVSYIACTTEKIFEMKPHLYDVYVDNQNVTTSSETLRELLKISDADRDKFSKLKNQRNQQQFLHEQMGDDSFDEEDMFTSFFTEQNNRLIQTLIDVSTSQDRQLTSDHMKSMGLDPIGDRSFLMELVETYGIDVMLMVDNPCCPT